MMAYSLLFGVSVHPQISFAEDAANALKITAQDLHKLGVVDEVIAEPIGGAHRDHEKTMKAVGKSLDNALMELSTLSAEKIKEARQEKFLNMGNDVI